MKIRLPVAAAIAAALSVCAHAQLFYTVENNTGTLYTLDVATLMLTPVGPLGVSYQFGDLAFDSSTGRMYMSDGWGAGISVPSSLYTVDLNTGSATLVGSTGVKSVFALAYDPATNKLYGATSTAGPLAFVEINRTTGVATSIGSPGLDIDGMTYVGSTSAIVGLRAGPGSLHTIDPATGASTPLSPGAGFVNNCGIAWSATSNTLYAIDVSGVLYAFDVANSYTRQTLLSSSGSYDGLSIGGLAAPITYCTAGTTTNGCNAMIAATGNASATAGNGFSITVSNVEGQKQGMIFYGINNTGFAPSVWGNGGTSYLCAKSPLQRTGLQNSGGTISLCNGALVLDWNAFRANTPTALGSPFSAGLVVYAQGWFFDPPSAKATNLSNGLQFAVGP